MVIGPEDITGVDDALALRVLGHARTIAPCLNNLTGDDKKIAIAILEGVAAEALARGSRQVKSQRIGSASVDYGTAGSWFADDDKAALRALCASATAPGLPVGSFPAARPVGRVWPEGPYSE